MASNVAKSVSRALGLVIYKSKLNGGFPCECFSKLYDSLVWPVIDYGSCIWGTNRRNCIEAAQTGHAGILWQLENTPRILLYKEIWVGCHHKLEFGIPWGDAGQGLKI